MDTFEALLAANPELASPERERALREEADITPAGSAEMDKRLRQWAEDLNRYPRR